MSRPRVPQLNARAQQQQSAMLRRRKQKQVFRDQQDELATLTHQVLYAERKQELLRRLANVGTGEEQLKAAFLAEQY